MQEFALRDEAPLSISNCLYSSGVQSGFRFLESSDGEMDDLLVRTCEIPAPPFKEEARARFIKRLFEQAGLKNPRMDGCGNVLADRPGRSASQKLVVSAHLDTVFPEGTDVRVRRDGPRLCAPGISDNTVGLASLQMLARALQETGVETESTITFAATVGEEGEGNLRGVRHLFTEGEFSDGAQAFISLDGPGLERITNRALGSRRFRIEITGPGGHSWGDFGTVNPVHAMGRAIGRFSSYPAPVVPRTSFNVGVIEGGNSVNAIPQYARMTIDLRSESKSEIDKLESYLRRVVDLAVREENVQRATSGTSLSCSFTQIGSRPAGETPPDSLLVTTAVDCSRALGIETRLDCSSTDSNIPISMGIPSITIGAGGSSGNCHSLAEWYDPHGRELGLKRLLLLVVAMARLA